jgi:hypothetical protein
VVETMSLHCRRMSVMGANQQLRSSASVNIDIHNHYTTGIQQSIDDLSTGKTCHIAFANRCCS